MTIRGTHPCISKNVERVCMDSHIGTLNINYSFTLMLCAKRGDQLEQL